jgi:A/G-specific adenine glycosylase
MRKFNKSQIRNKILVWGREHYQNYPWRDIGDPWLALLAEVLLQRTNATHVNRFYKKISTALPDHLAVLNASEEQLKTIVENLGLQRRTKTLVELAYYVDYQDYYPDQLESLLQVHGIGHYTASAYLSLHMNVRAVLLDSNIARWLSRMLGKEKPTDVRRSKELWELADQLTPKTKFKEYNYAVLDFTMLVCKPRRPLCDNCPLTVYCAEHQKR